ncbi:DUF2213 domain-containing protein [Novosphingobium sp.]|uniref:DUF2213 domain-containing protein n=1 Tax=Novosphingobium sp. TaxID=1874826 RepID=UPI00286D988A|nr:DUF2213 domain-containing protein [Novosphingobium sp.]
MQFFDRLTLDKSARICADGSLVAEVLAARTGLQDYASFEMPDRPAHLADKTMLSVYRPASEVFKADSLATFAGAPITVDHPSDAVTADNWRELGVGEIHGDVVRDGERVRVPIIIRDASAVKAATTTHKQLSMGYATRLVFPTDGKHPDGTVCDAYQTEISINHIALVPAARGGPELRVVDERAPISLKGNVVKKIVLDGLQVDLGDADAVAAAISKLQDKIATGDTALTDANGKVATLTAEKATLEKQLADAKLALEPAAIEARVADRAAFVTKAKAIKADIVTDGRADADIRAEIVTASLGDAAKDFTADQMAAAFAVLAKDAKPAAVVVNIAPAAVVDARSDVAKARDAWLADKAGAHRAASV